jgi:large subunit ribosomal protein L24
MSFKIRKNDKVIVISGSSKGEMGVVENVDRENRKVLVSGVNYCTHYVKANSSSESQGLVRKSAYLHLSNVSLVSSSGDPVKVRWENRDGKKVRVLKKNGELF